MFSIVESESDLKKFHEIKELSWVGKGFEMEYAKALSDQCLIYTDEGEVGGTFEFTPYLFTSSYIRSMFDDVVGKGTRVIEVDSFAVLPQYRGKLGRKIISLMIHYAEQNGYTHGVGLSDPDVFKSLNNTYGIPMTQVKDTVFYKGADVFPTVFHLREVYQNKHLEKYAWLTEITQMKVGKVNV